MQNLLVVIGKIWRPSWMRVLVVWAAALPFPRPAFAQLNPWLPSQLEVRVPFEPTAFPSELRIYLFYEIHLSNLSSDPIYLSSIEVLDADAPAAAPIATFTAVQLPPIVEVFGAKAPADSKGNFQIVAGASAIVWVSIVLDQGSRVPDRLIHRVATTKSVVEGAIIGTHHTALKVVGPPLEGAGWLAHQGPGNFSHHRRGMLVVNGRPMISERYATDWIKVKQDSESVGDPHNVRSYYSYGMPVLAVADGRVVEARDGSPDNLPGQNNDTFQPAVPSTSDNQPGNMIVVDLGGGQYAHYFHLQPGSVRVKRGDRVRRGELLARVGNSGDARGPHLHFEMSTSATPAGEGVPYVIDRYRSTSASGQAMGLRKHELPLNNTLVDFPRGR